MMVKLLVCGEDALAANNYHKANERSCYRACEVDGSAFPVLGGLFFCNRFGVAP